MRDRSDGTSVSSLGESSGLKTRSSSRCLPPGIIMELLVPHVPSRFKEAFKREAKPVLCGAVQPSRRSVEVRVPRLDRYFIMRHDGVCVLLVSAPRNNVVDLLNGIVHTVTYTVRARPVSIQGLFSLAAELAQSR